MKTLRLHNKYITCEIKVHIQRPRGNLLLPFLCNIGIQKTNIFFISLNHIFHSGQKNLLAISYICSQQIFNKKININTKLELSHITYKIYIIIIHEIHQLIKHYTIA